MDIKFKLVSKNPRTSAAKFHTMFLAAARFEPSERETKRAKYEENNKDNDTAMEHDGSGANGESAASDSDFSESDSESTSGVNKAAYYNNQRIAVSNQQEDKMEVDEASLEQDKQRLASYFDDGSAQDNGLVVQDEHYQLLQRFRDRMSTLASKHKFGREMQLNNEPEQILGGDDDEYDETLAPLPSKQDIKSTEVHGLEPIPQLPEVEGPTLAELGWIAPPTYVDESHTDDWDNLGVGHGLQQQLHKLGYNHAFAVQTRVVPFVLTQNKSVAPEPLRDVLVNALTGSGKTLAYVTPIVEVLQTRTVPKIRALIVVPTRPLCIQVYGVFASLCEHTDLRVLALGQDVKQPIREEQELLRHVTPDILVSTPGRLVDHLRQMPELSLGHLRFLVVDEADRLLNQSFDAWTEILRDRISADAIRVRPVRRDNDPYRMLVAPWGRPPQKLVFSATLTRDPGKLMQLGISPNPQIFVLSEEGVQSQFSVPQGLTEHMIRIDSLPEKPLVLVQQLLVQNIVQNAIVFVKSSQSASRLAELVRILDRTTFHLGLKVDICSGDLNMNERNEAIKRLENQQTDVLIATDLVARGLDLGSVEHVLNYDIPGGTHEYVHRVGRTARAGKVGHAWNIVCGDKEEEQFWRLTNSIARKNAIDRQEHGEFADELLSKYDEALAELSRMASHR